MSAHISVTYSTLMEMLSAIHLHVSVADLCLFFTYYRQLQSSLFTMLKAAYASTNA